MATFRKSPTSTPLSASHPLASSISTPGNAKLQDKANVVRQKILPDRPTFSRQKSYDKWCEPDRPTFSSLGKWFRSRTLSMESLKMFSPKKPVLLRQASIDIQAEINKKEVKSWPNRISPLKKPEQKSSENVKAKNRTLLIQKPRTQTSTFISSPLIRTPTDIKSEKICEINKELNGLSAQRENILFEMSTIIKQQYKSETNNIEKYRMVEHLVTCMSNTQKIISNLKMISKTKAKISTKEMQDMTEKINQDLNAVFKLIDGTKNSTGAQAFQNVIQATSKERPVAAVLRRSGSTTKKNAGPSYNYKLKRLSLPMELGGKSFVVKEEWLNHIESFASSKQISIHNKIVSPSETFRAMQQIFSATTRSPDRNPDEVVIFNSLISDSTNRSLITPECQELDGRPIFLDNHSTEPPPMGNTPNNAPPKRPEGNAPVQEIRLLPPASPPMIENEMASSHDSSDDAIIDAIVESFDVMDAVFDSNDDELQHSSY